MNSPKFPPQIIGFLLVIVFLVGCGVTMTTHSRSSPPPPTPIQPNGQPGACRENELSPLGVSRSTDHGVTWTSLGNVCLHDPTILSVDPTPLLVDGRIVLYFLDMKTLTNDESTATRRIIYRATSLDGMNFDKPQPAFSQTSDITDPFVLRMPDGSFRMYMMASPNWDIISAASQDGLVFTRENGTRSAAGGIPGALPLPDNQVRLYLAGGRDGQDGILSEISDDGLSFTLESGLRIVAPANSFAGDAEPIRLTDGSYLMSFSILDKKYAADPVKSELHIATSADGYNWTANPSVITHGGTSCVVEMTDGTLLLYYGK